MPAEFDTGFVVREPAWHGLATVLSDYPGTWSEARVLAGLDWEPEERLVYDVVEMYADGRARVKAIDDFKQVVRDDTGARLAIPQESYTLTPNAVMGEIIEAMLHGDVPTRYECAGSIEGGKRVWAMLRVGEPQELPGDPSPIQPYLALLNSHDQSAALKVVATNVRIVCANTWHAADMDAGARGSAYSFKHTKNWKMRVDEAKKALSATKEQIEHTIGIARDLLRQRVTKMQRQEFINEFAVARVISTTVAKNKHSRMSIEERMEQPRVQAALSSTVRELNEVLGSRSCDGIRDTAYGLVQAAGEFCDHKRDYVSSETYFTRTMFNSEPLKYQAVKLARQVTA